MSPALNITGWFPQSTWKVSSRGIHFHCWLHLQSTQLGGKDSELILDNDINLICTPRCTHLHVEGKREIISLPVGLLSDCFGFFIYSCEKWDKTGKKKQKEKVDEKKIFFFCFPWTVFTKDVAVFWNVEKKHLPSLFLLLALLKRCTCNS